MANLLGQSGLLTLILLSVPCTASAAGTWICLWLIRWFSPFTDSIWPLHVDHIPAINSTHSSAVSECMQISGNEEEAASMAAAAEASCKQRFQQAQAPTAATAEAAASRQAATAGAGVSNAKATASGSSARGGAVSSEAGRLPEPQAGLRSRKTAAKNEQSSAASARPYQAPANSAFNDDEPQAMTWKVS